MSKLDFRHLNLSRTYTVEELEEINKWIQTKDVGLDNESSKQYNLNAPIVHFQLSPTGNLIPMLEVPIKKNAIIKEIILQLNNWKIERNQHGVIYFPTLDITYKNVTVTGPDITYTPKKAEYTFNPSFIVEIENVGRTPKYNKLVEKIKNCYFSVENLKVALIIDPINKRIYRVMREKDGRIRCRKREWTLTSVGDVLPEFTLNINGLNTAISQVFCHFYYLGFLYCNNINLLKHLVCHL